MLRTISFAIAFLLGLGSLGYSQCTLRGEPLESDPNVVPSPRAAVACLDLNSIDGQTVVVPENVSRIDARGIAICSTNTAQTITLPPAIIFILDQSTSMENNGGDPNHLRAQVVRDGIQQLYTTAPKAYFSYIEFAEDIELPLTQSANPANVYNLNQGATNLISEDFMALSPSVVGLWASDTSPIQRRAHSGTNYVAPLRRAKEYINALRADTSKHIGEISIIFISDGQPFSPDGGAIDTILTVLDSNYEVPGKMVPIHGIFMGQNGTALQSISTATGGSYEAVDPTDPNALGDLMAALVTKLSLSGSPTNLIMNVDGVDYTSRSMTEDTSGGFQVRLNSAIPLDSGLNSIEMEVTYLLENGETATRIVSFQINVTDTPSDTNYFDAGGYFVGYCNDTNSVSVVGIDSSGYPNTINPDTTETLDITFNPIWFNDSTATLDIRVVGTGDLETITIPANLDSAGLASYIASLPIVITSGSSTKQDSTLQVLGIDTVWFHWVNPDDSTDTMDWMILIGNTQQISATNYNLAVWETDSIGTRLKALADHKPGEIYPTDSVPAKTLAGSNVLIKAMIAGLGSDQMSYNLLGGDTGFFRLKGDTLVLARSLDYETDSTKVLTYTVSDGTRLDTGTIRIAVLNVNELPYGKTIIVVKSKSVAAGELIQLLSQKDPEGDSITMRVLNSNDGEFSLIGDSLVSDAFLKFRDGDIYRIPIEVSDGTTTDTMWVEIHMLQDAEPESDDYIRQVRYVDGTLTITSGTGPLQIHTASGDLVYRTQVNSDGTISRNLALDPGVYIITIGCAKQTFVVTGN